MTCYMSELHVRHIRVAIEKRFRNLIDISDVTTSQAEDHFLTRGLSAFVVAELSGAADPLAAKSVVDEGLDGGIDALYFDTLERRCYLVQSKWIKNGEGTPSIGSVLRFKDGVHRFFLGEREYFGPKMQRQWPLVERILEDSRNTYVLVLAYTGKQSLASDAQPHLDDLVARLNDPTEIVVMQILRQRELHDIIAQGTHGEAINLKIMLRQFGRVTEPYSAYYGQVDLKDVSKWGEYGQRLYDKNIRGFKGSTEVNEAIMNTVRKKPQNFWYFNNGITVVAEKVTPQALGSGSQECRVFECEKASVINGAQTVGSICHAVNGGANGLDNSSVSVRIISLDNCPLGFGDDLAKAANTQNRIESKDYVAQDPLQARLYDELFVENQKRYVYRTGDSLSTSESGFTFEEAAVALACAHSDISLCVQAKREVGKLWEDIQKAPYTTLFNEKTNVIKMWRTVEIMRAVEAELKASASARQGKPRLIASHGNRFILHMAFRSGLDPDDTDLEATKKEVPAMVGAILEKLIAVIAEHYKSSYPASLFKNLTMCRELAQEMGTVKKEVEPVRKEMAANNEDQGRLFQI